MKRVTLQDIGDKLNLSKVTVYNALNNKPGLSEETRNLVLQTAKAMNYKPSNSHFKTGLTFVFAIHRAFFCSQSEKFYTNIYYHLINECKYIESSINLLLYDDENEFLISLKEEIEKNYLSGIFFAGETSTHIMESVKDISIPVVYIDFYSPSFSNNYVFLDNYHSSLLVTNYLINHGHTNIGFIGNTKSTSAICDRYFGYLKALMFADITPNPKWFINQNIEKTLDLDKILPDELPTAFVCHCDEAARALYLALRLKNLSVPDDISVISFDNTDICKELKPNLTSVGASKERYAKRSLELMLDTINGNKEGSKTLRPTLHERASVKKL